MNYGLQLFSVRDIAQKDYGEMLFRVAEMGYRSVEPAGFFENNAKDVAAMLKRNELDVIGAHVGPDTLFGQFKDTLTYLQTIGCKNLVLPWVYYATAEELAQSIKNIHSITPTLEREGMTLHFHNHWEELRPNQDGQITVDELAKHTDVLFELDTFWAFDAGVDPVRWMEERRDRIRMIHIKDGFVQDFTDSKSHAKGMSLGLGEAPVKEVRRKAIELGFDMIVESEGLDPTGLEEVKRCIDFLKEQDITDSI